ncbi:MAG: GntR family transcriptional regulator [Burkholderiales bacterium]|nr:GntR family transcriptional regulator [Burkholderiales bacterium]
MDNATGPRRREPGSAGAVDLRGQDQGLALGSPLYREVKRQLIDSLRGGEWKPAEVIPSEKQLAARYGVSIGTVRKAVDEMVADKMLVRHQGRGTYVVSHSNQRQFFYFFRIVGADGVRQVPSVELLRFARTKADATQAARLGVLPGARLVCFANRLSLAGVPAVIDEIAVPEALFPELTQQSLRERPNTVYHFYQERFGISVVRIEEHLSAVTADAARAEMLGIAPASPLLLIRRVAYSFRDQPVEYRNSYVNTQQHVYVCESGRAG